MPSLGADGPREGARLRPHGEQHVASWQQGWAELDGGTAGDPDGEPQVPGGGEDGLPSRRSKGEARTRPHFCPSLLLSNKTQMSFCEMVPWNESRSLKHVKMHIFKHVEEWRQKNDPQAPKPRVRSPRHYCGSPRCPSPSRPDFRLPMSQHQGSGGDPGAPALARPQLLPSLAQSREAPPCDCDVRQGCPARPRPGLLQPGDGQPQATSTHAPLLCRPVGSQQLGCCALWLVPCSFSFYCASVAWAAWRCVTMEVTAGCGPSLVPPSACLWDDTLQKGQKLLVSMCVQPPGSSRVPSVFKGLAPHHHARSADRPAVS